MLVKFQLCKLASLGDMENILQSKSSMPSMKLPCLPQQWAMNHPGSGHCVSLYDSADSPKGSPKEKSRKPSSPADACDRAAVGFEVSPAFRIWIIDVLRRVDAIRVGWKPQTSNPNPTCSVGHFCFLDNACILGHARMNHLPAWSISSNPPFLIFLHTLPVLHPISRFSGEKKMASRPSGRSRWCVHTTGLTEGPSRHIAHSPAVIQRPTRCVGLKPPCRVL